MRHFTSNQHILLKIFAIVAVVMCFIAGLLFIYKWESSISKLPEKENFGNIVVNGQTYMLRSDIDTFLIIGLDKFETNNKTESYVNNKQADFLLLVVFDHSNKKYSALHINRDSMTEVNVLGVAGNRVGTKVQQIALAHTHGNGKEISCNNTTEAVSNLLNGIDIKHYLSLTMDAVSIMNDMVGGVSITVMDDLSIIDPDLISGSTVTLTGQQALQYIRSRKGLEDSSNRARMKRQQQYMLALLDQIQNKIEQDNEFLAKAALELSDYIVSDRSVSQLHSLSEKFNAYEFTGVIELEGDFSINSEYVEFYPDQDFIQNIVLELFYAKSAK